MKRLNPLYIILLFLTFVFISFFQLNSTKNEYKNAYSDYEDLRSISKDFNELKTQWNNEKYVNETLDVILKNKMFSNQKILRAKVNNVIKLKIESSDPKILDNFLNKILNKPLQINKLELDKSFVNLEIGVK